MSGQDAVLAPELLLAIIDHDARDAAIQRQWDSDAKFLAVSSAAARAEVVRLLAATPASDEAVGDATNALLAAAFTVSDESYFEQGAGHVVPSHVLVALETARLDLLAALSARTAAPAEQGVSLADLRVTEATPLPVLQAGLAECEYRHGIAVGRDDADAAAYWGPRAKAFDRELRARLAPIAPDANARSVTPLVPWKPGNWPEDASGDNGDYECVCVNCGEHFYGHKRRVICKVCSARSVDGLSGEDAYAKFRESVEGDEIDLRDAYMAGLADGRRLAGAKVQSENTTRESK